MDQKKKKSFSSIPPFISPMFSAKGRGQPGQCPCIHFSCIEYDHQSSFLKILNGGRGEDTFVHFLDTIFVQCLQEDGLNKVCSKVLKWYSLRPYVSRNGELILWNNNNNHNHNNNEILIKRESLAYIPELGALYRKTRKQHLG